MSRVEGSGVQTSSVWEALFSRGVLGCGATINVCKSCVVNVVVQVPCVCSPRCVWCVCVNVCVVQLCGQLWVGVSW